MIKLGEGVVRGPEDVWVDAKGVLYTATRDGWIKRLHKNGTWQDWKKIDSDVLLGITTTKENELIVCDAEMVRQFSILPLIKLPCKAMLFIYIF